jgi:transcriptional regulator with XRE-family HTH domain
MERNMNQVRAWRQHRGLTQHQLAELIDTGPQTISKLERGERRLNSDWIAQLCAALQCTESQILRLPPDAPLGPAGENFESVVLSLAREMLVLQQRQAETLERLGEALAHGGRGHRRAV